MVICNFDMHHKSIRFVRDDKTTTIIPLHQTSTTPEIHYIAGWRHVSPSTRSVPHRAQFSAGCISMLQSQKTTGSKLRGEEPKTAPTFTCVKVGYAALGVAPLPYLAVQAACQPRASEAGKW